MTIAVDLGRKATKQTNRLQGESIAGKWADRRTLLTYIPHHWGIGILLLHTPVAQQIWLDNLSSCLEDSITNKNLIYRRRQSQYLQHLLKREWIKKNQIKISPNDQPDYPVNSVINLLTCTTLTKCCTAINAAVNNNDNGKIV